MNEAACVVSLTIDEGKLKQFAMNRSTMSRGCKAQCGMIPLLGSAVTRRAKPSF
jgi:hypothetical protein